MEMMTVKQVSALTGVSVRTLQFYDEIGLLKPTKLTAAGYRLYDEQALAALRQILFFKELDFPLKEIKAILADPQFEETEAYVKQRELLRLKRDRLNNLLELLDRLIEGKDTMDFKAFDLSEYFAMLAEFKTTHTEEIVKQLGSMEAFEEMLAELQSGEDLLAAQAAQQYGSAEAFKDAMQNSLTRFLEQGPAFTQEEAAALAQETEALTRRLTADLGKDPASPEVQDAVHALVAACEQANRQSGADMGENYWRTMAELYRSNPVYREGNDQKYGAGASCFISRAIEEYLRRK